VALTLNFDIRFFMNNIGNNNIGNNGFKELLMGKIKLKGLFISKIIIKVANTNISTEGLKIMPKCNLKIINYINISIVFLTSGNNRIGSEGIKLLAKC
jgi:hypothetical protein